MASCSGLCCVGPVNAPFVPKSSSPDCCCLIPRGFVPPPTPRWRRSLRLCVRASAVDSSESSSDFIKRMEQAWLISQQPMPINCSSCDTKGHVECKWCGGTGFFILGDNMLCQVPSRNTTCVICTGKGSTCCSDCKGTGFRAKWLGKPSTSSG